MFLDELQFDEKQNFLELAAHAMEVNGEVKKQEKEIYHSYMHECRLPNYTFKNKDISKITKELATSSARSQKIILLEVIGILIADNELCEKEEDFLFNISQKFDLSKTKTRRFIRWYQDFAEIIGDGYQLIGES